MITKIGLTNSFLCRAVLEIYDSKIGIFSIFVILLNFKPMYIKTDSSDPLFLTNRIEVAICFLTENNVRESLPHDCILTLIKTYLVFILLIWIVLKLC